jgi:small subunit ribosomal protein S11
MAEDNTTTPITENTPATSSEVKSTSRKKRAKRPLVSGQMHIKATFNNTIVTITDKSGAVFTTSSSGANGFRGSKKGTAYAAQVASEKALTEAKNNHGLKTVDVFVKGIGQGRDMAIRGAATVGVDVLSITDKTGVPHGGVRPKKVRHP